MSNFVIPFSCVALLGAAVFYSSTVNRTKTVVQIDRVSTKKNDVVSQTARIWVLKNVDTNEVCLLYKTRDIKPDTIQLDIDPACDNVFVGSGLARYWVNHGNNQISIADDQSKSIARFKFDKTRGFQSLKGERSQLLLVPST